MGIGVKEWPIKDKVKGFHEAMTRLDIPKAINETAKYKYEQQVVEQAEKELRHLFEIFLRQALNKVRLSVKEGLRGI